MKTIITAIILCAATATSAATIINDGFEDPIITAASGAVGYPGGSTGITGWTATGNDVVHIRDTHVEAGPLVFNAQEGSQHVDVTGAGNTGFNDGIFQDVATVVGQQYTLTYWIGRANGVSTDNRYQTPSTVLLGVGGSLVATSTNADTGPVGTINWKAFSHTFTATSTSTQIGFFNGTADIANGGNNFAGVDNVAIAVVPEPCGFAALGAAMLGLSRKRK